MSCHTFDESEFSIEDVRRVAAENRLLSMEIEFSRRCNFRCPYCYQDASARADEELTAEEARDVLRQARDLGARTIVVLGGEPMIYPSIMEMLAFIRDLGMNAEIFTNGSRLTPENARKLAQLDVKVVLKFNTKDRELQNRLCGRDDAYDVISSAYANLKAAGYGQGGRALALSSVISRDNLDELPELWTWIREEGAEPYFEMITPQGGAKENDWLDVAPERIERLFAQLAEIDRKRFGRDWSPQPPLAGNSCLRHLYSCYVDAYGEVMPCVGIDLVVGNLRKKRLSEIIRDSEVMQDLRGFRKHIKGPCASCDEAELCYGCRGAAYQLTGDYLASDPLCWHNADRKGEIERLPMPVEGLLPHGPEIRVVDMIRRVGEREAETETFVTETFPFLDEAGCVEPEAFMEIVAQASAAHNGFRTRHLDERFEGFLLGVRNLKIFGEARLGDRLFTTVFKEASLGDFGVIRGEVRKDDRLLASAEIKIYHRRLGELE